MNEEFAQHISAGKDAHIETLSALLGGDPTPESCGDTELAAVDFSRLDVLVGTVRSDDQLDYCLQQGCYYVPARTLTPAELPPSVIALYEEGLNRRAGIKRYGRVTETRVVKRGDIPVPMSRPNPDEAYYLFTVASWDYLEHPIAILDTARGKPMFTNEFLLTHCRRSYQLLAIRSPEEYRLCELLYRIHADGADGRTIFRRIGERYLLSLSEGWVRLLTAQGDCLYACPVGMLADGPAEVLRRMAEALGLRGR